MVIAITNADIESHTAIEFLQIPFYIRTVLDYEIYWVEKELRSGVIFSC